MAHTALGPLAFWEGYEDALLTLTFYAVGIALYALLVAGMYRTLSRRNLLAGTRAGLRARRSLRFVVLFPVISFSMFLVLAIALSFLAKSQTMQEILLLAMAVVASIRVAAYFSETAREDLAKLMPLGLLAVLSVDPGFLRLETPVDRLASLPGEAGFVARLLVVLVVLEVALRIVWLGIGRRFQGLGTSREPPEAGAR
ncbi:MAG TPA: hypothetical protein VGR28_14305 [Candidatus Thermoplasmatota archaeon]|jgi:hypothetical protein|nr:hypothetical protein [Candidatus Thermoplasmatota archaeon]